jgi:SAM-dependent methyltransferase
MESGLLNSCQCTQAQLESPSFRIWTERLHTQHRLHRKLWELCYISQALYERNKLHKGSAGLGFAVGQEPLSALFAAYGCNILATDLDTQQATKAGWVETNQHAESLSQLNQLGICPENAFSQLVKFKFVDMRLLPDDLGSYDFIWSCCSLEHLGTIGRGVRFIEDSLKHLRPGGVAVHTMEYNTSSNWLTVNAGPCVLFRKRDIQSIAKSLTSSGCKISLDFRGGDLPADRYVDKPPYAGATHLKLRLGIFTVTSFGLIIEKTI